MWKKQDDAGGAQPQSTSKQQDDAVRLLGDVLNQPSANDELQKRDAAVAPEKTLSEDSNQPVTSPRMDTYTEAVKEFTTSATALIEHLPLLTKARAAYQEAMRASTEMRKALDTSDDNLRSLMTQLEQQVNLRDLKSAADKKPPEPAKVERVKASEESEGRAFRWP